SALYFSFFFQAEDGIRDFHVTGVQTCALPISPASPAAPPAPARGRASPAAAARRRRPTAAAAPPAPRPATRESIRPDMPRPVPEIGRASCRERVQVWAVAGSWQQKDACEGLST